MIDEEFKSREYNFPWDTELEEGAIDDGDDEGRSARRNFLMSTMRLTAQAVSLENGYCSSSKTTC